MKALALATALAALAVPSAAREHFPGQYAQVDPAIADWFSSQHAPGSRVPCCSTSDGARASEERRGNAYWVQFTYTRYIHDDGAPAGTPEEVRSEWMEVPDAVIIRGGENPVGAPIVWWYTEGLNGEVVKIRCYKPAIDG